MLLIFYKSNAMVGKYGHYITDREIKSMSVKCVSQAQSLNHEKGRAQFKTKTLT